MIQSNYFCFKAQTNVFLFYWSCVDWAEVLVAQFLQFFLWMKRNSLHNAYDLFLLTTLISKQYSKHVMLEYLINGAKDRDRCYRTINLLSNLVVILIFYLSCTFKLTRLQIYIYILAYHLMTFVSFLCLNFIIMGCAGQYKW